MAEIQPNIQSAEKSAGDGAPLPARLSPFATLQREMDRLFDEFSGGRHWFRHMPEARAWAIETPAVDIAETDDAFEVSIEMPGTDTKDIDISASDGTLSIKGEKKVEKEVKKKRYYLSERHYGAFERSFALPRGVDVEKISADHKAGVLKITLPKTSEAKAHQRKIEIKSH